MSLYQYLAATDVYETHMSRAAYLTIDQTAVLDQVMRQNDDDFESCAFHLALTELRDQAVNEASWHLLLERCKQNLSADEIRQFDDAIHLYEQQTDVNVHNHDKIHDLERSILTIPAVHSGTDAFKATSEQCDLLTKLNVCIDAKIMLVQNF